jgi:hypothetical protein
MLRLAAQVQARTQQLTAEGGQRKQLLVRTHGLNLAAAASETQDCRQIREAVRYFTALRAEYLSPIARGFAVHQEMRIQQLSLRVVSKRCPIELHNCPARSFDDSLSGRGVPLTRRSEPWIQIGCALRHETKLQRAANSDEFAGLELRKMRIQCAIAVRATAYDAQRSAGRSSRSNR